MSDEEAAAIAEAEEMEIPGSYDRVGSEPGNAKCRSDYDKLHVESRTGLWKAEKLAEVLI